MTCNQSVVDRHVVDRALALATPELENAQLRAAIALQLVEVRESRTRIVAAQQQERRTIERNLHDGAQQRLLAIALQLKASHLSNDDDRRADAVADAIEQIQQAVVELRTIANGLRPPTLNDAGLGAALDELAARIPMQVHLDVSQTRFEPEIEAAAWYIACEAVANAIKHSGARSLWLSTKVCEGRLRVAVRDDGTGGANPASNGLRGIADRAEALGGRVTVESDDRRGTTVTAELPCDS